MPRKIQRKPIRKRPKELVDSHSSAQGFNIQGTIAILGGITGIIVAILWVAGRFYTIGYFGAMNIPAFQINFSVWEYAELSWLKLIIYFLKRIFPIAVLLTVVPLIILILVFLLQKLFPKLKLIEAINKLFLGIKRLWSGISYLLALAIIVLFSYILLQAFIDINKTGQIEGKDVVFSSSYAVQIFSKDYLPLGSPKAVSNLTTSLKEYDGLRLLRFNNGKYYLFRDIDPYTCKPSQVFVITDSPDIILVLSTIAPIDIPCTPSPVE
jgi:hypothetical protein